ncbi:MAG: YcaO-like family protein [Pseudonocardiales bacterium]|nr:YcaO-like family protein [Pseudonocardiales bacterium]MBW0010209.1 YcaO-like family protein [Pseudonocardiales bacterium]
MTCTFSRPLRRLAEVVEYLVDPRVGIIGSVTEARKEAGGPDFFHYGAEAANTLPLTGRENFRVTGGAAATREGAVAKAIGEAIERYCSAWYVLDELPRTSYRDAPFACVAPEEFALYSEEQYGGPGFAPVRFTPDTTLRWTSATEPATGECVYLPAARVYLPYAFYAGANDAPIVQPISTGLACHLSREEAAIGAICEVVERDAVTITWQAMLAPPRIRVETLPEELYDLVSRFERAAGTVVMFDITLDHGIPAVLSVLRGHHDGAPALVVAASASPSLPDAARKSLEELAHTRRYAQLIATCGARLAPDPPHYHGVQGQRDHLNFWADHRNLPLADFLFASPERVDYDDLPNPGTGDPVEDLRLLVNRITGVGERVLLVDLTTPDVGGLGFSVVRAVVPGLHPLQLGHRLRALGGRRLWTVPQRLGHPGISPSTGDNPAPHPYP